MPSQPGAKDMSVPGPVVKAGEPPTIGPYRIAGVIGSSSSCVVYLAMDTREGAWRALKVLSFESMGDDRARARFQRDGEAALAFRHPHFLTAHDAAVDDPYTPWLALEVCEGGSLADWVERSGPMPVFLAIEVGVQICSALAAAHRKGIAQRRLEPHDVLIAHSGQCKLKDFRVVPSGERGFSSDSADLRNDIVSAGRILSFLLTGRRFHEEQSLAEVPAALLPILQRSQQRGRGQGFADAAAMGRELEAAMLEVAMPSGRLPSLWDPEAALPDDFDKVYDPEVSFPDLERAARWAEDPTAGPEPVQRTADNLLAMLASGTPRSSVAPTPMRKFLTPGAPAPSARPPSPRSTPEGARPAPTLKPVSRSVGMPLPVPQRPSAPASTAPAAPQRAGASPGGKEYEEYVPDYVVKEPERVVVETWRHATPKPVRREVAPKDPGAAATVRILVLGAALLVAIVGTFTLWSGIRSVQTARVTAEQAGENLTAVVEAEAAVVNDLAVRGADRALLESHFYAYREARGSARHAAAEEFARVLLEQAARAGIDPQAPVQDNTTRRVGQIAEARASYLSRRADWGDASRGFPGVVPVMFGIAAGPGE